MGDRQTSKLEKELQTKHTIRQLAFDMFFGIVLPLSLLEWDPFIFGLDTDPLTTRWLLNGRGALLEFAGAGAAMAVGFAFVSLAAWLLVGWPPALLAGLRTGAMLFAATLRSPRRLWAEAAGANLPTFDRALHFIAIGESLVEAHGSDTISRSAESLAQAGGAR